jgi:hypothetical protein
LTDSGGNPLDIFTNPLPTCSTTSTGYLLNYVGGAIKEGEVVTIAEQGVVTDMAGNGFPSVTVDPGVAPEPASISLLSTGIVAAGSLFAQRRRRFSKESRK